MVSTTGSLEPEQNCLKAIMMTKLIIIETISSKMDDGIFCFFKETLPFVASSSYSDLSFILCDHTVKFANFFTHKFFSFPEVNPNLNKVICVA